jgi:hypothetical protein
MLFGQDSLGGPMQVRLLEHPVASRQPIRERYMVQYHTIMHVTLPCELSPGTCRDP